MRTQSSTRPDYEALYYTAQRQAGFFTAQQAVAAGYSRPSHSYHVKTGDWRREVRGVYRLRHFPAISRESVVVAYLCCSNLDGEPQGVISHDTALEVYNLSTWSSSKFHLTVPKGFRKRADNGFQFKFYYNNLPPEDVKIIDGYKVTKPLRTIVDLLECGQLEPRHIKDALREAFQKHLIRPSQISELTLTDEQRYRFKRLLNMFDDPKIQNLL